MERKFNNFRYNYYNLAIFGYTLNITHNTSNLIKKLSLDILSSTHFGFLNLVDHFFLKHSFFSYTHLTLISSPDDTTILHA